MEPTAYIYTLSDPRTGEVRYVGKTHNLQYRYGKHLRDKRRNHRWHWIHSLLMAGVKPKMEVLEEIYSQDDSAWQESERFWIETLKFYGVRLVNAEAGGSSGKKVSQATRQKLRLAGIGHSLSPETRSKISAALKGRTLPSAVVEKMRAWRIGRKRSPETCAKLSLAFKGRKFTIEHRQKISLANIGKKINQSTRSKISKALTGLKRSDDFRAKVSATKRRINKSLQFEWAAMR